MDKKYVAINTLAGCAKVDDGYFWSVSDANVYSNKSGTMTRLAGSLPITGSRRYTLQYKRIYRKYPGYAFSISRDALVSLSGKGVPVKDVAESNVTLGTGRSKGWIIGSVTAGNWSIASNPKIHLSEDSVNAEIERLAKGSPARVYVKLEVNAYAKANGVSWS